MDEVFFLNPRHYAIKKGISNDHIEKHMLEVCVQKVNELSRHQMVWTDEDGFLLKPLEPGRLMTKYYLKFDTMKYIIQTPVSCTLEDVLHVICRAEEISWIQLRRNEKKLLNDINSDKDGRLRFHILGDKGKRKKRIQTREEKIFLLANDCLTGDPSVHDLSLTQDMNSICSNGCRIARCMKEFFIYQKNYRGALNSMLLAKSMYQKLWDDSPYLLKQLPGIGMVTAKALHSMGVKSFETLAEADPRRIEIVTGRKYPFGNHIKESLMSLPPKVELRVEETEHLGLGKLKLAVTLTRLSPTLQSTKHHYADMIVGSEEDNLILFHEKIRVDEFSSPYSSTIFLPKHQQGKLTIKAVLIFEDYIGIDLNQELILMKESNLSANNKRGRKKTSVPLPEEVCIIDDDTYDGPSEVLPKSTKSKTVDGCMPSFKLLDDDSEDDEVGGDVHEDEIAAKVQNGVRTVTQQTVFDHIREKAKNFPAVVASNSTFPPSSESLLLARKRVREKKLGTESGAEVPKGNKVPRRSVVNPSSELKEQHQLSSINDCPTPRGSAAQNFMNDRAGHPSDLEDGTLKMLTGETIFDHIRAKAKNFLVIGKPNVVESESLLQRKESRYKTLKEFRAETTAMRKGTELNEVIKDYECDRELLSGSYCSSYGKTDGSPVGSRKGVDHSSSNMLSFNMSMFTNPKQPADVGCTMESTRKKQKLSPIVPPRHCSMTAVGKSKQAETFLGFESVFSFL